MLEARQEAIKELLRKEQISDQKKLVKLLRDAYGIKTNQAVISRDLRKLGVIKKQVNDNLVYEIPASDTTTEILKLAIVNIEYNEAIIVIKTHPGLAAFVGDCLDRHPELDILGSLAGENVVFVTPRNLKKIEAVYQVICHKLHFRKN